MSVYIPKDKDGKPKSSFWSYDFILKVRGQSKRFTGSTGQTTRRAAEAVEAQLRFDAATGRLDSFLTIGEACDRYWTEVAQFATSDRARATASLCLREVVVYVGEDTRLVDITPSVIAGAVSERASTPVAVRGKNDGIRFTDKMPAPATVNRQLIEPLRRVMRRAKRVWGVPLDLDSIPWTDLKLKEPEGRTRELTTEEELRMWQHLDPEYHGLVELFLVSGKRQSVWIGLKKFQVDVANATVRLAEKKRNRPTSEKALLLTDREAEIIAEYMGRTNTEHVFVAHSKRNYDEGAIRPITSRMLYAALKDAMDAASIKDFRPHDLRHTFASRARRAGADIKELMVAMDHRSIQSTLRYTHMGSEAEASKGVRQRVTANRGLPSNVVLLKRGSSDES